MFSSRDVGFEDLVLSLCVWLRRGLVPFLYRCTGTITVFGDASGASPNIIVYDRLTKIPRISQACQEFLHACTVASSL